MTQNTDKLLSKIKTTEILPCNCKHEFQDTKYGIGKRLHNFASGLNASRGGWRCTVCGTNR